MLYNDLYIYIHVYDINVNVQNASDIVCTSTTYQDFCFINCTLM